MINTIQLYSWGTKGNKAFIPNLLGLQITPGLSYAELWIGAHPKSPSEIVVDEENISLYELIRKYPQEILGEYVISKFGKSLPFLLKVLSAERALSIQTHPDKKQAEQLNLKDPQNYPDDNHKPEIAIAIDSLNAIAGFLPVEQIKTNLQKFPEIFLFAENLKDKILGTNDKPELASLIRELFEAMMRSSSDEEKIGKVITGILGKVSSEEMTDVESQFIKQHKLYGNDIGLLSFFFLNMVNLKPGQAIYTEAGVPHAYIEGNIIECMANSDNVVRAGLTKKYKDINTLLDIINYNFSTFKIINEQQQEDEIIFKTPAEEFEVSGYKKNSGYLHSVSTQRKPSVGLLINGCVELIWLDNEEEHKLQLNRGESFLIPAQLDEYKIQTVENSNYYLVNIP